MNNKITTENFSETNRSRVIGNSLYKICEDAEWNKWYIHETYNDGKDFALSKGFFGSDVSYAIEKINSLTKEREIVSLNTEE